VKDLERERNIVGNQIALAVNQLKDTKDLLNMFNDSKTVNFSQVRYLYILMLLIMNIDLETKLATF